jgi:hypothetical protein
LRAKRAEGEFRGYCPTVLENRLMMQRCIVRAEGGAARRFSKMRLSTRMRCEVAVEKCSDWTLEFEGERAVSLALTPCLKSEAVECNEQANFLQIRRNLVDLGSGKVIDVYLVRCVIACQPCPV